MKYLLFLLLVCSSVFGQTVVNNPNGTVSLKGTNVTYNIDPAQKFRVMVESDYSNLTYNGIKRNGKLAYKNCLVDAKVNISLLPSSILTGHTYQVFRSTDLYVTYDPVKFDYDSIIHTGVDLSVIDTSKTIATVVMPGVLKLHTQIIPKPTKATGFQFNFGGFIWGTNNTRSLATIRFKVKSDFYFPIQQTTDIKIIEPSLIPNITNVIDGGIIAGTNSLGPIFNNANQIRFVSSPEYKVNLKLLGPDTKIILGQAFKVKVLIHPASLPQFISSVSTIFTWDTSKIEFMGLDKTGAKSSQMSYIGDICNTCLNEAAIPKDGTAQYIFLSLLGDKSYISSEQLIVTFVFKAISPFDTTTIEVVKQNDPRVAGFTVRDDTDIIGSFIPSSSVAGTVTNSIIKGELYAQ